MLRHRCPWCGEKLPVKFFRPSDPISIIADEGQIDTCPHCKKMHKSHANIVMILMVTSIFMIIKCFIPVFRLFSLFPSTFIASLFCLILGFFCILIVAIGYYRLPYKKDMRTEKSKRLGLYLTVGTVIIVDFITIVVVDFNTNSLMYWNIYVLILFAILGISYSIYILKQRRIEKSISKTKTVVKSKITWENHKQKGLLCPRLRIVRGEIFPACFMNQKGTPISTPLCVVLEELHWKGLHSCTCTIQLVLDNQPEEELFQPGNQFYLYHEYRKIAEGIIS